MYKLYNSYFSFLKKCKFCNFAFLIFLYITRVGLLCAPGLRRRQGVVSPVLAVNVERFATHAYPDSSHEKNVKNPPTHWVRTCRSPPAIFTSSEIICFRNS